MPKPYEDVTLVQFQKKFRTEKDCKKRLFQMRWAHGFICPRCGHDQYYDLPKRGLYQCKACKYQCSVTAGTVMHRTRTPLLKWFWAIFLFSNDKRGISALQLSKKLDVSYWVAWTMLHKIRKAMRDRDARYKLAGLIEVDDSYVGGSSTGGGKRGRGTRKIPVLIAASTDGEAIGFAKMQVVDSLHWEAVKSFLQEGITPKQTIKSDGSSLIMWQNNWAMLIKWSSFWDVKPMMFSSGCIYWLPMQKPLSWALTMGWIENIFSRILMSIASALTAEDGTDNYSTGYLWPAYHPEA